MNANEIEIICVCGDHITLTLNAKRLLFAGYCIGCDRNWFLGSIVGKERKQEHGRSTKQGRTGHDTIQGP